MEGATLYDVCIWWKTRGWGIGQENWDVDLYYMNLLSLTASSLRVLASSWELADSLRSLGSGCLIHISFITNFLCDHGNVLSSISVVYPLYLQST